MAERRDTLDALRAVPPDRPVLIAGPTASGKSALALALAERQGRRIVNADALQVHADWRLLTARPDASEAARAPHDLYGHVAWGSAYAVGDWLRDVAAIAATGASVVVVGGTGLYFRALTEGLAAIPPVPAAVREEARARLDEIGLDRLATDLSPEARADMDLMNPIRVLRAWEVERATGRSIRAWQAETPAPLVPLARTLPILLDAPPDWLNPRIDMRFDRMLEDGSLDEVRRVLPRWDADAPAARAIGAPQLIAHLRGEMPLAEARALSIIATRRYAKRQRTWFRARMATWRRIAAESVASAFDKGG